MLKVTILAALLAGCTTTAPHLGEPERSMLYAMCLQGGVTVTACECIEAKAVEETGITRVRTDEASAAFLTAAEKHAEACMEEAEAAFGEDAPAKEEATDTETATEV